MEELRDLAWTEFQEYTAAACEPSRDALEVVTISTGSSEELTYVHSGLGVDEAASFFDRPLGEPHSTSPQATLRLVRILRDASDTARLAISPDTLQRLAGSPAAGFDPASFWLLAHRYDGFHRFPAGSNRQYHETLFFGSSLFCALWSFDPKVRSTFALLLCRASSTVMVQFVDRALAHYKAYILAPTMLGYVFSKAVSLWIERVNEDHERLRQIERDTGFAYGVRPLTARHSVRKLTQWLQESGQVAINMTLRKRNLRFISDVLEYMMTGDETYSGTGTAATPAEVEVENRAREFTIALLQAVPPLQGRIRANDNYMDYLKLRAERLSTTVSHSARARRPPRRSSCPLYFSRAAGAACHFVLLTRAQLFALLTHEDAATSAELADASRALAAAARRDSSAMKTMAVMTMAFLPGTFLAALFAVPSLDWTSDPRHGVIQPNHWVYWAFTLPATVLVFLVWLILDNRRALLCFVSKRMLGRGPRTRRGAAVPDDVALD